MKTQMVNLLHRFTVWRLYKNPGKWVISQLQTSSTTTVKAIYFASDKTNTLIRAMETKTPVNFKKKINLTSTITLLPTGALLFKITRSHLSSTFQKSSNAFNYNQQHQVDLNDTTYIFKNLRVKEDNYTKQNYVNTAKEGFEVQASSPFTETLPDVGPLLLDLTTKITSVSIISIKSASSYSTYSACSKKL